MTEERKPSRLGARRPARALLGAAAMLIVVAASACAGGDRSHESDRIAFRRLANEDDCGPRLYAMRADGEKVRRISGEDDEVSDFSWSPDGSSVAILRRACESPLPDDVFVLARDGDDRRLLVRRGLEAPSWSPDGRLLAVWLDTGIHVVALDGSRRRLLTRDGFDPAWSPTGERIVFTEAGDGPGRREIHLASTDGSGSTLLTRNGLDPAWSPDGRSIAFTRVGSRDVGGLTVDDFASEEIYVLDVAGRRIRRLTRNTVADKDPVWSPDGRSIVFVRWRNRDRSDVYVLDVESGRARRLTRGGHSLQPAWSPDGRRIAYTVIPYPEGKWEIHVVDAEGGEPGRLTEQSGQGKDGDPAWLPPARR
jgi:TolB protein